MTYAIIWFCFGLIGTAGRAYARGCAGGVTSLHADYIAAILGPIGAVAGIADAAGTLGLKDYRK